MRDIIFNVNFHLTFFAITALILCLFYISTQIISVVNKAESLKRKGDPKKWEEIPIKVEKEGYFIEYEFPNRYSREYPPNLSELQIIKAASFEFETLKSRIKKREIERKSGGVTIFYRGEDGKLRNKITLSNNPKANYSTLMDGRKKDTAFRNLETPKLVVLSIPNEYEIKEESKKMYFKLTKTSSIYLFFAISISIASVYF